MKKIKPAYLIGAAAVVVILAAIIMIPKKEKDVDAGSGATTQTSAPPITQSTAGDKKYETFSLDIGGKNIPIQDMAEILPKLDDNQKNFITAFITAVNAHDAAAFRKLVHPASLGCLDKADPAFAEHYIGEQIKYNIPNHYAIAFDAYTPHFPPDFQKTMDQWYLDPVTNTHLLFIHYRDLRMGTETIQQKLLAEDDNYYVVLGCPTEITVSQYMEANKARSEAKSRFREAYSSLSPNLRATLKGMLKTGQHMQAVTRYAEESKQDIGVAELVIQALQEEVNKEKAKKSGDK